MLTTSSDYIRFQQAEKGETLQVPACGKSSGLGELLERLFAKKKKGCPQGKSQYASPSLLSDICSGPHCARLGLVGLCRVAVKPTEMMEEATEATAVAHSTSSLVVPATLPAVPILTT